MSDDKEVENVLNGVVAEIQELINPDGVSVQTQESERPQPDGPSDGTVFSEKQPTDNAPAQLADGVVRKSFAMADDSNQLLEQLQEEKVVEEEVECESPCGDRIDPEVYRQQVVSEIQAELAGEGEIKYVEPQQTDLEKEKYRQQAVAEIQEELLQEENVATQDEGKVDDTQHESVEQHNESVDAPPPSPPFTKKQKQKTKEVEDLAKLWNGLESLPESLPEDGEQQQPEKITIETEHVQQDPIVDEKSYEFISWEKEYHDASKEIESLRAQCEKLQHENCQVLSQLEGLLKEKQERKPYEERIAAMEQEFERRCLY